MKIFASKLTMFFALLLCFSLGEANAQSKKVDLGFKGEKFTIDKDFCCPDVSKPDKNFGGVHSHGNGWGCIDTGKKVEPCGYSKDGTRGVGIGGHFGGGKKGGRSKDKGKEKDPFDKWQLQF